jgi:serine/threonine protein kinase/Flp pilus assembly protein TadD
MIGQTISHYKILGKLGEGGMGVVYKAEDTKLKRIVALKFLPAHLTGTEEEQARFQQEAQSAATLNHPNICTIHAIEEFDGRQFIDMEYVEGETLRKKLPLPKISDAVTYAAQIGEALQEAHAKGIVHRDIKADNIMVNSKNQIKVMDFGLAKLKGSLKLTKTSSTVGTLAYMAPEQIQGGDVDARSDIFSFGVLFFEMLTGKLPFRGEHEAATMYSILNEEPDSVQKYRQDASPEIDHIIKRALEKDPADRYQHIDDMVSELRRSQKQSTRVVRPETGRQPAAAAATPQATTRRTLWIALGSLVVVAAIGAFLFTRGTPSSTTDAPPARKMLVVLPFENLGSQDQEYFADGLTEEVTSKLSGLSGLGVIARSSANQYKKSTKTIKQIGEELGVTYVLQGTIRWENDNGTSRVRVTPQLINVADGTQIWSQPSEAVLSSAFQIQADVAGQVAGALNVTLLQKEKQSLEAKLTENADAYDAYLRGNEYAIRSSDERDHRIAEQMLTKAVELDPNFAAAYAKLAIVHAGLYWEFYDRTKERQQKSKEAAEKAVALNPDLPDAHGAMGFYYYHCLLDYENAIREFKLALQTQPNNIYFLLGIASVTRRQGRFEEAAPYFVKACEIDPRSGNLKDETANTFNLMRRYDTGLQYVDEALSLAPDLADAREDKALNYVLRGNTVKAREVLNDAALQKVGKENHWLMRTSWATYTYDVQFTEAIKFLDGLEVSVISTQNFYLPKDLLYARTYGYLGEFPKEKASFEAATKTLEHDLQLHPEDTRIISSLGIAYAGIGRKDEALSMGKKAVELLPITKDALIGTNRLEDLALIYTMLGKQDEAIKTLERLLSIPSWTSVALFRIDPAWKPLLQNPQFTALLNKYGSDK